MNFITTNIRFPEEDYFRLKEEALKKRKSLAALIRDRVTPRKRAESAEKILQELRKHAAENAKYLKGIDGTKIIREMRDNAKW